MPSIDINVQNKIATAARGARIVCGNSDYTVNFEFDAEWNEYNAKTARFKYNGVNVDVPFNGNVCKIPIISDAAYVEIGVYSGKLTTTTAAVIECNKSVLCDGGLPPNPEESVYLQIIGLINELKTGGASAEEIAAAVESYMIENPVSCNIKRVESLDTENIKNLRDLETGSYILCGYFRPHAGADAVFTFPYNVVVGVVTKEAGTHVQVCTPVNNVINFLTITDDSYTRENIYLSDFVINVNTEDGNTFTTDAVFADAVYYHALGRKIVFNIPHLNVKDVKAEVVTDTEISATMVYQQEGTTHALNIIFDSGGTVNIVTNPLPYGIKNIYVREITDKDTGRIGSFLVVESKNGEQTLTKLPDAIPVPKKSTVGDLVRVSGVDDNGFPCEWETIPGTVDNPDIHEKYFEITRDGIVSLKPEYRGANTRSGYPFADSDNGLGIAGSKNAELPEYLVIPETVGGTAVVRLADGIFLYNAAIKNVVFPSCVEDIPERCFDNCAYLRSLYNTDHVKSIGKTAFQSTSIIRAKFPNLETISGVSAFQNCGRLIYADVGGVSGIPDKTFNCCASLSRVKSQQKITSVGEKGFSLTGNLCNLDFVSKLTNIGKTAFYPTRFDYDWNSLTGCTFGTDATQAQINPTDIWSACNFTACKNPLPTQLTQDNPMWSKREIGKSGVVYEDGCGFMTIMHAYCGLHNISVESVEEFEDIINANYPGHIDTYSSSVNAGDDFMNGMGLTANSFTTITQEVLQTLYNALAAGKYAQVLLAGTSVSLSHAVLAYGINSYGEILIIDSVGRYKDDLSVPAHYAIPYKNLCGYHYKDIKFVRIISL